MTEAEKKSLTTASEEARLARAKALVSVIRDIYS